MAAEKIHDFPDGEVVQLMKELMLEKSINADDSEAFDNIEFLVEIGSAAEKAILSDYKFDFTSYLKDRKKGFARYLAQLAKEDDDQRAFEVVKALIAAGDIQKEMSISAIKEVLNNNVLNAVFDGNKKEEKKEEKPKVSENKKQSVDELNALVKELGANKEAPYTRVQVSLVDPNANPVLIMPSGVAFGYFQMNDNATAEEMMALVLQYERFVLMAKELGATYGIAEHRNRQVPQQQYGDVDRSYAPPAPSEKPAQPKGNTQQDAPAAEDMRDRKIIGLSKHTDTGKKGEYTYYKPYYWDADKKQMSGIGMIFTNSAIAKEIAKIVPVDVLNSLGEMPTTLPPSAIFTAFYTVKENGDKKYSTFHRVEKAGQ